MYNESRICVIGLAGHDKEFWLDAHWGNIEQQRHPKIQGTVFSRACVNVVCVKEHRENKYLFNRLPPPGKNSGAYAISMKIIV